MKTKEELINKIIADNNYNKYLEIGTQFGYSVNKIKCHIKHTIDPDVRHRNLNAKFYNMTSDEFFSDLSHDELYDVIFIDGSHISDQVLADVCNAGGRLVSDGCLILHDLMPVNELAQKIPRSCRTWNGDCWKVWYLLMKGGYNVDLEFYNFDEGIGVVRFGRKGLEQLLVDFSDNLYRLDDVTYKLHFEDYLKRLEL